MIHIPESLKRPVPIQEPDYVTGGYITYDAHLRAFAIYSAIFGIQQSAERIAERGGFAASELDDFYPEWRNHIIKKETKMT